jgi:putative PEP-CTERM system histidine kinase
MTIGSNAAILSFGLGACAYLLFSVQLLLGRPAGYRKWAFLAAVLASAAWETASLGVLLLPQRHMPAVSALLDVLRYAAWFAFINLLLLRPPEVRGTGSGLGPVPFWGAAAAVVVIGAAAQLLGPALSGSSDLSSAHTRFAILTSLALPILGLVLIEQLIRNTPTAHRWSVMPLCIGLGGAFSFDLFLYAHALLFNQVDTDLWSARGLVHAVGIPLIAVSAARTKAWSTGLTASHRLVFHYTALLGAGVYLLAVSSVGYYIRFFGGDWGRVLQATFLVAALLLFAFLVLSGTARSTLRVLVSKHLFSHRYDYREEWLRFTRLLSAGDGQLGLQERCVKALADLVESPGGTLWIADTEADRLRPAARWNMPELNATEPLHGALPEFFRSSGWIVDLADYQRDPDRYPNLVLPAWLAQVNEAWLLVPLLSGDALVGFAVLANPRTRIALDWEVSDLLKTAGRQAGSYLAQAQATEALLEARKFDAFNRMSAFVVHDLKNIVAQLSLMLKNSERHGGNPEFQRDLLMTVDHAVGCMNNLLLQLRSGTIPVDRPRSVELEPILRRVQQSKAAQRPAVEVDASAGARALGHEDRLERVIGHLVQNAIEASARAGKVLVRAYQEGDNAIVEVIDEGLGMSADFVRERLFKPFQTTKVSGMGIGAYESLQYITGLGGQIQVQSAPNAGTRVKVLLPRPQEVAPRQPEWVQPT